jgi:anaphase-promoting complex subunit 2
MKEELMKIIEKNTGFLVPSYTQRRFAVQTLILVINRINTHKHSDQAYSEGKTFEISALIVSSQFWSTFKKEELPEPIQEQFEKDRKSYELYKGNRTLCWTPLNGKVWVEIELDDRKLELSVSPA